MSNGASFDSVLESLRNRGKRYGDDRWHKGKPDYVAEYNLTSEHVAGLLALSAEWVGPDLDADDLENLGSIHAWRALGQLRAVEAIAPLLELLDPLDDAMDECYLVE